MIATIGLIFIILGWTLQLLLMNNNKNIHIPFIFLYAIGVIFLVYDSFSSGLEELAIANIVSFAVSIAVLIKIRLLKRAINKK